MLNEVTQLGPLVAFLRRILEPIPFEVIIVDGGSTDGSGQLAEKIADRVIRTQAGRARQLNAGAQHASGTYLYFLHADTLPPEQLGKWLEYMYATKLTAACFSLSFTPSTWLLRKFSYCTRYNLDAFRYGDQSLLVRASAFRSLGGYREALPLMEGNDIVRRLKKSGTFEVLSDQVITSSRKYQQYGVLYLQSVYVGVYLLNRLGLPTSVQLGFYNRCLGTAVGNRA